MSDLAHYRVAAGSPTTTPRAVAGFSGVPWASIEGGYFSASERDGEETPPIWGVQVSAGMRPYLSNVWHEDTGDYMLEVLTGCALLVLTDVYGDIETGPPASGHLSYHASIPGGWSGAFNYVNLATAPSGPTSQFSTSASAYVLLNAGITIGPRVFFEGTSLSLRYEMTMLLLEDVPRGCGG